MIAIKEDLASAKDAAMLPVLRQTLAESKKKGTVSWEKIKKDLGI